MNQEPLKVVVSGAVGAGKTTLVKTLSDTEVVATEALSSVDIGKETTTVAMDFGTLTIAEQQIYLFGTPGQPRFDFMWEILCEGALGLLFLVSGARPEEFIHSRAMLDQLASQTPVPFVVGVTHTDHDRAWQPEDVALFFQLNPAQVLALDPRDRHQGWSALYRLLELIVDGGASTPADDRSQYILTQPGNEE